MNVSEYAVSVQWGKGIHHFARTDFKTLEEAEYYAARSLKDKKNLKAKHIKPTVHVWHIVSSHK